MHVCLISDEYLEENPLGGIGTYTRQLCKMIESSGHQVTVVTFGKCRSKHKKGNMAPIVIRREPIPKLSLFVDSFLVLITILRLNKQERIDVIEVPEWRALGFFIALFRRLFGTLPPLVVRLHTPLVIVRFYNGESLSMMDRVRDWMERFSVRFCDAITSPSRALAVWVSEKWRPRRQIVVIPNFIETIVPKVKTSMNHKGKTVLFIGNLAVRKGFAVLMDALPIVFRETNAECHIVGRKSSDRDLNRMLEEVLSHWKGVKYLGFVDETAKMKELEQSDVVVIPSLWENFAMICIEALASSKVVVASKVGGLKEIISDGVNGFLVPAADHRILASAIKGVLLMDPIQRKRIENNAKRTVETRYASSVIGKTMIDFYFRVAEHKKT